MSPLCSLNVNRLLPLLLLLPTRAWVLSPLPLPAHCSLPPPGELPVTAFRFTFYCQCAHMVSSLCSRLYCHYHHHVAINTPSHTSIPPSFPPQHPYSVPYVLHPSITARTFQHLRTFSGMGWGGVGSAKLFWDVAATTTDKGFRIYT